MAYCEHDGKKRHAAGSNGPRNIWYARTNAIATCRITATLADLVDASGGVGSRFPAEDHQTAFRRPHAVPRSPGPSAPLGGAQAVVRAPVVVVSTYCAPPRCVDDVARRCPPASALEGKNSPEQGVPSFGEPSPLVGCAQGPGAA